MGGKPDFIGLGAQKAATSWIHACLYEHPQVYMPGSKEVHFFSRHFDKGSEWYAHQFRKCRPDQVAGEFSPTYLYDLESPKRIAQWNPKAKLIICLRDPVKRVVSAYHYAIKTGTLPRGASLASVIERQPAFLHQSAYKVQIERYLRYFDRRQMLITLYEDIANDPYCFMQEVYRFLGIDADFRPSLLGKKVNESLGAPRSPLIDGWLKKTAASLREIGLDRFVWTVTQSKLGEMVNRFTRYPAEHAPVSLELQAELQKLFVTDVQAIEQLLQRDLRKIWSGYEQVVQQPLES